MIITTRPLAAEDHDRWHDLWTAYLQFYETSASAEVYAQTWERLLCDRDHEFRGIVAVDGTGQVIGLTHYLFHRHCWSVRNVCYLQDMFVDEAMRGKGAARMLIKAVYDAADKANAAQVYWLTQDFNKPARVLYDKVAKLTPFIKYQRS